ncbi:transposase [Candidatus Gottesmanbacteria bacterium]|nr:transposase [Candidatus Gottesmanbacteria bacterium]
MLDQDPPLTQSFQFPTDEAYLLIDGLWFGKRFCLMIYRQSKLKLLLHASFMFKEWGSLIAKDLFYLKNKGYRFTGVVSDGGTGIRNAVFRVFGHIPHQICLAHLHRDVINAIGRYPKDEQVKKLKRLADHLWLIESKEALLWWEQKLKEWTVKNKDFLNETRHVEGFGWWFIHKGVRKAVRILVSIADTSFKFLDRPLMPKTTNELEGSISVLARKHLIHKGLKRERVKSFLRWFIYFYNRKLLSQRKT